jgi:hypothetical protein
VLVNENVLPADAADPDDWRAELVGRYTTVSGFLKVLPEVIVHRLHRWEPSGALPSAGRHSE